MLLLPSLGLKKNFKPLYIYMTSLKKNFFRVFIESVTILLLFYVLVFWLKACGILAPQPGNKAAPPALAGKVFTTGPQGSP